MALGKAIAQLFENQTILNLIFKKSGLQMVGFQFPALGCSISNQGNLFTGVM